MPWSDTSAMNQRRRAGAASSGSAAFGAPSTASGWGRFASSTTCATNRSTCLQSYRKPKRRHGSSDMPSETRERPRRTETENMKEVPLSQVKDDLSRYLRQAAKEEIVITRHGKAAGVLIGFASEDDWFDYRLENDPRFLDRIAAARANLR